MAVSLALFQLALAAFGYASPLASGGLERRASPTVYLAGDSTMAKGGGGSSGQPTEGWGQFLRYSLNIPVVNNAIGGRSARSFTREGRFDAIAAVVKSGDFVVIEFGHNDGGSLTPTDNGRSDCGGEGSETCQTTYNGVAETVHTFNYYVQTAGKTFQNKGAHVIISSQTPNNPYESGSFTYTANRFVNYAKDSAAAIGAEYVDHGAYVAEFYQRLGASTVNAFFPNDHTHTAAAGANYVAAAFVKGVLCGDLSLSDYVKNSTSSVYGQCL